MRSLTWPLFEQHCSITHSASCSSRTGLIACLFAVDAERTGFTGWQVLRRHVEAHMLPALS